MNKIDRVRKILSKHCGIKKEDEKTVGCVLKTKEDFKKEETEIINNVKKKLEQIDAEQNNYNDFLKSISPKYLDMIKSNRPKSCKNPEKIFPIASVRILEGHMKQYLEYLDLEYVEPPKWSDNPIASFSKKLYLFKEKEKEQIYMLRPSGWVYRIEIHEDKVQFCDNERIDWFLIIQAQLQKKYPSENFEDRDSILENVEIFTKQIHVNYSSFKDELIREYNELKEIKTEDDFLELYYIYRNYGKASYHCTTWWILFDMTFKAHIEICLSDNCKFYSTEVHHSNAAYDKLIGREDEHLDMMTVLCRKHHEELKNKREIGFNYATIEEYLTRHPLNKRKQFNNNNQHFKNKNECKEKTNKNESINYINARHKELAEMLEKKQLTEDCMPGQKLYKRVLFEYLESINSGRNGFVKQEIKDDIMKECLFKINTVRNAFATVRQAPLEIIQKIINGELAPNWWMHNRNCNDEKTQKLPVDKVKQIRGKKMKKTNKTERELQVEKKLDAFRKNDLRVILNEMKMDKDNWNELQKGWAHIIEAFVDNNRKVDSETVNKLILELKISKTTLNRAFAMLRGCWFDNLLEIKTGQASYSSWYFRHLNEKNKYQNIKVLNDCAIKLSSPISMRTAVMIDKNKYNKRDIALSMGISVASLNRAYKLYNYRNEDIINRVIYKKISLRRALMSITSEENKQQTTCGLEKSEKNINTIGKKHEQNEKDNIFISSPELIVTNMRQPFLDEFKPLNLDENNDVFEILMNEAEKARQEAEENQKKYEILKSKAEKTKALLEQKEKIDSEIKQIEGETVELLRKNISNN